MEWSVGRFCKMSPRQKAASTPAAANEQNLPFFFFFFCVYHDHNTLGQKVY